jgi:hypothetical protein
VVLKNLLEIIKGKDTEVMKNYFITIRENIEKQGI